MPLQVEAFTKGRWRLIGVRQPGDQPASISQLDAKGKRQILVFQCLAEESRLYRSRAGVDVEQGTVRKLHSAGFDLVNIIKPGDSYRITIKLKEGERHIRLTHLK